MEALGRQKAHRRAGTLVLDVRSPAEYRRGHVPGSRNIPVGEIRRDPARVRGALAHFDTVYVHCSSGHRARRAFDALAGAGLANVVHVGGSGMRQWRRRGYPVEREIPLSREVATGLAAGLVASLAAAPVDRALKRLVSEEQKRRERAVREASPHEQMGFAFKLGYGLAWGVIYALVRRRMPAATRFHGLPFAAVFFLACDGLLAPLLRMSPGLEKIPWQFNAKELANHAAWTATAEAVHRVAEKRA